MNISQYEKHAFSDPALPIFFHLDHVTNKPPDFWLHWHENPEFLFIVGGSGFVKIDDTVVPAEKNSLITINSNKIHSVSTSGPDISYYCLIVDKNFCDQAGFHIEDVLIREKIDDPALFANLRRIITELDEKKPFYKAAVMGEITNMLLRLFRNYTDETITQNMQGKNIELVKKSILYMKKHCTEHISIADVAAHIGYSKYYFCRTFKQVTGSTVNTYLNSLKIQQACTYLKRDGLSVSETAAKCGFNDISYFTKIFKQHMQCLPSVWRP